MTGLPRHRHSPSGAPNGRVVEEGGVEPALPQVGRLLHVAVGVDDACSRRARVVPTTIWPVTVGDMPVGQRYPILPIPWIPEHTEMIPAGVLTIGVGHRVLDEATAKAYLDEVGYVREATTTAVSARYEGRDAGVCIHVLGPRAATASWSSTCGSTASTTSRTTTTCTTTSARRTGCSSTRRSRATRWHGPSDRCDPDARRAAKVGAPELAAQVDPAAIDAAMPEVRRRIDRRARTRHVASLTHLGYSPSATAFAQR